MVPDGRTHRVVQRRNHLPHKLLLIGEHHLVKSVRLVKPEGGGLVQRPPDAHKLQRNLRPVAARPEKRVRFARLQSQGIGRRLADDDLGGAAGGAFRRITPFHQFDLVGQAGHKAHVSPDERFAFVKANARAGEKAQFGRADVTNLPVQRQADDAGRLLAEVVVDGLVIGPGHVPVPGADVAPEEGEGRPVSAGVCQFSLQQPVLHGVGVEGNAGEQPDGRYQSRQQGEHEQPPVPHPPRGQDE